MKNSKKGVIVLELQVYIPTGSKWEGEKITHAPRLPDLNGMTIGEISNRAWEADNVFPVFENMLKKRYPDIKFVSYEDLPNESANIVDNEELPGIVAAKGCDAVIGGVAG